MQWCPRDCCIYTCAHNTLSIKYNLLELSKSTIFTQHLLYPPQYNGAQNSTKQSKQTSCNGCTIRNSKYEGIQHKTHLPYAQSTIWHNLHSSHTIFTQHLLFPPQWCLVYSTEHLTMVKHNTSVPIRTSTKRHAKSTFCGIEYKYNLHTLITTLNVIQQVLQCDPDV